MDKIIPFPGNRPQRQYTTEEITQTINKAFEDIERVCPPSETLREDMEQSRRYFVMGAVMLQCCQNKGFDEAFAAVREGVRAAKLKEKG